MPTTDNDMFAIAGMISKYSGDHFEPSNLINYGQTIIVKPGARTRSGRLIRGRDVAAAVGGAYTVHPLAVSYGSDGATDNEVAFEKEMDSLLQQAETDAENSEDEGGMSSFGAARPASMSRRSVRLRRRYQRISRRFGKFASKAVARKRRRAKRVASRIYRRIVRLWAKMKRKQIPTRGLLSPSMLKARITTAAKAIAAGASADTAFDQAALERSVGMNLTNRLLQQQIATSAFGSEGELYSDTRAETLGFVFGRYEHDYYGIIGEPFDVSVADEEAGPEDDAEIDEDLNAEIEAVLADDDLDGEDVEQVEDEGGEPSDDELDAEIDAELDAAESDDEADGSSVTDAAVSSAVRAAASDVDAILSEIKKTIPVPASDSHSRRLSRARTRVNELLRRRGRVESTADSAIEMTNRLQALKNKLDELDAALKNASERGSINYAALRPAGPDDTEKLLVIGVRKDSMGSAMAQGYTPADAYNTLLAYSHPSDFRGSLSEPPGGPGTPSHGKFPSGPGAPFPPPRMAGKEIF